MNTINTLLMIVVVICLIIMTVIHSKYIYTSWCESEIEIFRFQMDDIHNKIIGE